MPAGMTPAASSPLVTKLFGLSDRDARKLIISRLVATGKRQLSLGEVEWSIVLDHTAQFSEAKLVALCNEAMLGEFRERQGADRSLPPAHVAQQMLRPVNSVDFGHAFLSLLSLPH